ncbi:hypothetical protein [Lutimonas zeaxanthinifaciens]|uniref:hypothetical protein n=1 Tax=Lutimonas zeaxanthinifaciens TaxID=3060215 RepID=UPI00265CB2C9|nr:hypothetical protein [Lutimonas sp. YSD2104]WKK67240.1 hypothetical protein QZH61_06350 [Lutimonas sp. YSD2104]
MKGKIILFLLVLLPFLNSIAQEIQLKGNGIIVNLDGTNDPNTEDGTLFPETPVLSSSTNSFTLTNLSSKKIHIDRIRFGLSDFYVPDDGHLHNLKSGESVVFDIFFQPNAAGLKSTTAFIEVTMGKYKKNFFFPY